MGSGMGVVAYCNNFCMALRHIKGGREVFQNQMLSLKLKGNED